MRLGTLGVPVSLFSLYLCSIRVVPYGGTHSGDHSEFLSTITTEAINPTITVTYTGIPGVATFDPVRVFTGMTWDRSEARHRRRENVCLRSHEVRVAVQGNNEPWFVATDVAKILGFKDSFNLTRGLDEDEKGTHIVRTPGGNQEITVISEAGLYSAILRSRVPMAKEFKRWVIHEVLPQIRKTMVYISSPAGGQPMRILSRHLFLQILLELAILY